MKTISTIIGAAMIVGSSPASAEQLYTTRAYRPAPRPVAAFSIAAKKVEMLAVTRLARADTPRRRAHLEECENMSKVFPGYPQPAFVSVDLRIKF